MADYEGYLLKFGGTIFPNKYILEYKSTPNQRLETSAERDQNGELQRQTLSSFKTTITFSTHILTLAQKQEVQEIINSGMVNTVQRKCQVTYWNDETNSYVSGDFYIPDIEFTVMDASGSKVLYNPISIQLIEY